jgi:hypothetical protein
MGENATNEVIPFGGLLVSGWQGDPSEARLVKMDGSPADRNENSSIDSFHIETHSNLVHVTSQCLINAVSST